MRRSRKKGQESGFAMLVAEAILGVLLGGAFASVWLAIRPVPVVDAPPKIEEGEAPRRHQVAYVSGRETPLRQSQWKRKQRAFLEQDPKGLELAEQDVNHWIATEFGALELGRKWETYGLEYQGGLPKFRFDGDRACVGLVTEVKAFQNERKLVVQAEGSFQERGGSFQFVPDRMLVGALPIPSGILRSVVADWLIGSLTISEPFAKGWSQVDDVKIEEGRMKVGFRQPAPTVVVESAPEPVESPMVAAEETLSDPAVAALDAPEVAAPAAEMEAESAIEAGAEEFVSSEAPAGETTTPAPEFAPESDVDIQAPSETTLEGAEPAVVGIPDAAETPAETPPAERATAPSPDEPAIEPEALPPAPQGDEPVAPADEAAPSAPPAPAPEV